MEYGCALLSRKVSLLLSIYDMMKNDSRVGKDALQATSGG